MINNYNKKEIIEVYHYNPQELIGYDGQEYVLIGKFKQGFGSHSMQYIYFILQGNAHSTWTDLYLYGLDSDSLPKKWFDFD